MLFLKAAHIFRQAQYDFARSQSEPVEDCAVDINVFIIKFKQTLNFNFITSAYWWGFSRGWRVLG